VKTIANILRGEAVFLMSTNTSAKVDSMAEEAGNAS
jgi:hypothetical protein